MESNKTITHKLASEKFALKHSDNRALHILIDEHRVLANEIAELNATMLQMKVTIQMLSSQVMQLKELVFEATLGK